MRMIKMCALLCAAMAVLSCGSGGSDDSGDENKLVISGRFQKIVEGQNIWIETENGTVAEIPRDVKFVPEDLEQTEEDMYCVTDDEGNFEVSLTKGLTYNVLVFYATNQSVEGMIKFNETDGNEITVPADAPDSFDLGILHATRAIPYGQGASNAYVMENPLPWLTETIDVKGNTDPVITAVDDLVLQEFPPYDDLYGYGKYSVTAEASDADGDAVSYSWFLSTLDDSASVDFDDLYTRRGGDSVEVFVNSANSHGTLTLIVTDARGGSAKAVKTF